MWAKVAGGVSEEGEIGKKDALWNRGRKSRGRFGDPPFAGSSLEEKRRRSEGRVGCRVGRRRTALITLFHYKNSTAFGRSSAKKDAEREGKRRFSCLARAFI